MTIEAFLILYLSSRLPVRVSGDIPSPMPDSFVTVEQTGSRLENRIRSATIAVQSWAPTRAEAATLNELVENAMADAVSMPEISRCALDTSYNYTDISRKHPRYQAVFSVVHYL